MKDWKGGIIAEGLTDPTIINDLTVYEATVSEDNMPLDYEGHVGRWHGYGVMCSREEIDGLQCYMLPGWYAHFWRGDTIVVVYHDKIFEFARDDDRARQEVRDHGRAQGIPEEELDFPTN